jgi:hypothetical protein
MIRVARGRVGFLARSVVVRLGAALRRKVTSQNYSGRPLIIDSDTPFLTPLEDILLQDVKSDTFHDRSFSDLYTTVSDDRGVAEMSTEYARRLIGKFAVRVGKQRLWTPMIIDTGARCTLLSPITLLKFGVKEADWMGSMSVGGVKVTGHVSPADTHYSDLNLVGMVLLEAAIPGWNELLLAQLEKGLRLRSPEDAARDDAFSQLADDVPMKDVVAMIATQQGYTKGDVAPALAVLDKTLVRTVGNLRALGPSELESLKTAGLPLVVASYLKRVHQSRAAPGG